jgi:FtsZ-binding cell division protein ZapB
MANKNEQNQLDSDELLMLSQYIQNQQQIINELMEKNMQLTTEVQVARLQIKQLESINNVRAKPTKRLSAFKQERLGLIKQENK